MSRSEPDEPPAATDDRTSLFVVGVGGVLTVVAGLSISVLAYVLVNTVVDGHPTVAAIALAGLLAGFGIYYLGLRELLGSRRD